MNLYICVVSSVSNVSFTTGEATQVFLCKRGKPSNVTLIINITENLFTDPNVFFSKVKCKFLVLQQKKTKNKNIINQEF